LNDFQAGEARGDRRNAKERESDFMKEEAIIVPARITRQVFQQFALFDTFSLQKRWKLPLIFALIMSALAGLCLAFRERKEGAALLGCVLLVVGLGLPLAYFLSYWLSLRQQLARIAPERIAYTLRLEPGGIQVTSGSQKASYSWETVYMAFRASGCIYLYVEERRAYLLPDGPSGKRVWELMRDRLPPEKARDLLYSFRT